MKSLRSLLVESVLLVSPTTLAACGGGGQEPIDAPREPTACVPQTLVHDEPEPPSAELLELVRLCEMNENNCYNLCQAVLYRSMPIASQQSCKVTHSTTKHTIEVGYCPGSGAEGRRPAGLANARRRCPDPTSAHLARAAFYEAASIHAFVQLARELAHHRAPRSLIAAVRRSAAEEITHARIMATLARARGATPPPVVVSTPPFRSIEVIAVENAREGTVGETWSALTAVWQARHAPTPALRATYARIADDEIRHAEVALQIDAWARRRLRPAARRRIDAEQARAIAGLERTIRRPPPAAIIRDLGVPGAAAARRLFRQARPRLWAQA